MKTSLPYSPEEPKSSRLKRLFSYERPSKQDRLEIAQIFRTSNFGFSGKQTIKGKFHISCQIN